MFWIFSSGMVLQHVHKHADICRVNINASSVPHLCSYKIWDLKAWVKYCNRENKLKEGNSMSCTDHVV